MKFLRAISENINVGMKIIQYKCRRDPQMHFKQIFVGGRAFLWCENRDKVKNHRASLRFGWFIKKSVYGGPDILI